MRTVVDLAIVRNNLKKEISNKLFSWVDVRNDFYNFGLNLLEDIIKYDNIGIFTNSLKDAIKIRNVNRNIPIALTNITNNDQIYDLIINNITLVIKDYIQLEEISNLDIKDKLSIILQIDIDNYEDGIKCKNYSKAVSFIESMPLVSLLGIYTVVNDKKHNNISLFKEIVENSQVESFVIGGDEDFVTDGFVSKDLFRDAIKYELNVDKCFKLAKNDLFINKKIKKDCYGVRIKANNIDLSNITSLDIGGIKYKRVKYNHNTLFMIGNESVKTGKKIDITGKIPNNCYTNWPVTYILSGKVVNLYIFD